MSDTPRTDAAEKAWKDEYENYRECGDPAILGVVDSDVAREMEREVAQLRARLEKSEQDRRKLQAEAVEWAAAKSGNMGSASLLRQYADAIERGEVTP